MVTKLKVYVASVIYYQTFNDSEFQGLQIGNLRAHPFTAAMMGFRIADTEVHWWTKRDVYASTNFLSFISLISAPAANALPLPVMTMAPIYSTQS